MYLRFNPGIYVGLGELDATVDAPDADADQDFKVDDAYAYETMYMDQYRLLNDAISGATSRGTEAAKVGLTQDQLLICRHLVRGYSLKIKKWREFRCLLRWGSECCGCTNSCCS
jgi:hypothetical protein